MLPVLLLALLWASVSLADSAADELIALHKTLVQIQSVTGINADPNTDERNVQAFVEKWLHDQAKKHNFDIKIEHQTITDGRDNLYVYVGGKKKTRVLLTSHVDTVPPYFPYRVEGDKIFGRGTNDDKGSVAGMMIAFRDLVSSKTVKEGDLSLLLVVGEEIGGEGMKEIPKLGLSWDAVIFGEPTDSKLASGQIGGLVFNITSIGRQVHSGHPELGINAIDCSRRVMKLLWEILGKLEENPKFGKNSLTIAQIKGGVADNAVPGSAWVSGSYRLTIDPKKVSKQIEHVMGTINGTVGGKESCAIYVDFPLLDDPLFIDHDVPGFDTFGARFGSDLNFLPGSHKKYLYGPGSILTAHTDHEFVSKTELIGSVEAYKKIVEFNLKR